MSYTHLPHAEGFQPGDVPSADGVAESPGEYPDPSSSSGSLAKRRRPSKGKIPIEIKRSASTPHLRNLTNTDGTTPPSPTSDKRRNKLGYHRTSVACGHCRRRKIRCLLAPDDPHGRCSNCIRLKKECNFYPVDQQPETAKSSSEPGGLSASVAPVAHVPSTPQQDQFAGINNINQFPPGSAIAHGIPLRSNAGAGLGHSQPEGEPIAAQAYPYHSPQGIDPGQWAMPNYQGQPMGGDGSPAYWAQGQMSMPLQNTVSSVAGAAVPGMIQGSPEAAYGFQQGEWAVPTRSMSYGHIESMPQYQQYVGQAQMGARTPTFPFVPTLGSNVEAMDVSSMPEAIPAAVHSPSPVQMAPQSYAYQQQAWDPYASAAHGQANHMSDASSNAFAAQWQAPLGKVDEEGQQQALAGQSAQPTYYSEPPNPG